MKGIQILKEVLSYIEEHLDKSLTLEALAELHYISLSHLHRIFSTLSQYSLKEYINKRRLTKASVDLIESEDTIINIAFKYGYDSYEGFSRAFKRVYNDTPSKFRKKGVRIELFPALEIDFISNDKGVIYMISVTRINEEVLAKDLEGVKEQYIICADIDQFAAFNEKYGYEGGDIVLAEAAKRLERHLKDDMKLYRIGGDEFIIQTEQKDKVMIEQIAKAIIQDSQLPITIKGEDVYFKMSLGIVKTQHNSKEEASVLAQAQEVMLLAKREGRNCYHIQA